MGEQVKEVGWIEIGNVFWGLPDMIVGGHNQLMVDEKTFFRLNQCRKI